MATTFKTFLNNDIATTRTMLHEAIPITGSLVSGTYGGTTVALGSEPHIKTYSHGMFQSVYDYPYLSSSANHIFDIAVGISPSGSLYSSTTTQQSKKANVYNQMAQILMGHDATGSIQEFDQDGNILAGGTKLQECFFLNFSRLLAKDEIKKGSFELELGVNPAYSQVVNEAMHTRIKLTDASGSDGYFVNSPAGEYGVLYAQSTADGDATLSSGSLMSEQQGLTAPHHPPCGLLFYQAGIAVISGSVFNSDVHGGVLADGAVAYKDDIIDCNGWSDTGADETIVFIVPTAAGGEGETTIYIDENDTDGDAHKGANTICIGAHGIDDAALQALIIKAINGTTDAKIAWATSGNGSAGAGVGVKGIRAADGGSDAINIFADHPGVAGKSIGVKDGEAGAFDFTAATEVNYKYLDTAAGGKGGTVTLSATDGPAKGFQAASGSTVDAISNAIRNRIYNLSFNNTTELNSSIYFCRANHNDFNYSSNPTYLSGSKLRVKNSTVDDPVSYITTVGMYSADNELLAVAKLSEPLKKDPSTELTLRVRLDY